MKRILAGFDIHVLRVLPRGIDVAHDLRQALPGHRILTVFDVGANVGQSTYQYLRAHPEARIVAFEPCSRLFPRLHRTLGRSPRVSCERLALGASEGEAALVRTRNPMMHHLKAGRGEKAQVGPLGVERVVVTTIDLYCRRHAIDSVDFLKVDTEGHDLEVLHGAEGMLAEGKVGVVQCECSVSPENTYHVGLDVMRAHLERLGYRLFGVYEQVPEWVDGAPNLRRVNAVFISPQLAKAGRR